MISEDALANILLITSILMGITLGIVSWLAHKKGINVSSRKFVLTVGITGGFIFTIIPMCLLLDIPFIGKIEIAVVSIISGIFYHLVISKSRQKFKDYLGGHSNTKGLFGKDTGESL